jgi:hypothetical protein
MIRLASALILIGMVPVVHVVLDPNGETATRATFFATPCVTLGILVYLAARVMTARSPR